MVDKCIYRDKCPKFGTANCTPLCYYFLLAHGESGNGGFWKSRNVPQKYDTFTADTLPKGGSFDRIRKFIQNVPANIEKGTGLYLYATSSPDNKLGTGNGKTSSAVAILNEFTKAQIVRHAKKEVQLITNPSLFTKLSDFQNLYNSQFRGYQDDQLMNSFRYYRFKTLMKEVPLLVIDDVAIRSSTEAFMNELYEIIDHRVAEEMSTIYTSNLPLPQLVDIYGDRIVSRIEGSTIPIAFSGADFRKKKMGV